MEQPELQVVLLHTSPVPQVVPFARLVQVVVLLPGWQLWQALLGLVMPDR